MLEGAGGELEKRPNRPLGRVRSMGESLEDLRGLAAEFQVIGSYGEWSEGGIGAPLSWEIRPGAVEAPRDP